MEKKWWHDKVAYQIYPKSFYDTNGDGIGDIPGIIEKLDYLADLGVDILWLSPCYLSPLADQGYDIADYYQIDPRFGTMEDMDRLIEEAKKRGIRILMDLVVNHCSDEHEWFQKAMEDPNGKYGEYFYLRDAKDGLPCNWRSYFGGSVWEPLPGTDKLYMHLFHKKQPDLNWENPQVREEVYKNINWWLDKGLGGFRIDAIINIKKPEIFHDYPADREDGLSSVDHMLEEAQGVGTFLGEMRDRTFAKYDAFSVGEVFNTKPEELHEFIGEHGYFSTMFDFNTSSFGCSEKGWHAYAGITAEEYKKCFYDSQAIAAKVGFMANIIENHDQPRGVSRYIPEGECCDASKKMLATINIMLRGLPFIYQGQEIGMENTVFHSIDDIDDISTIDQYHVALHAGLTPEEALKSCNRLSRDNARTPMHWSDEAEAGFTSGTPWLKINPNYTRINVKSQLHDEHSLFSFYKKLIALRKDPQYLDSIVYGEFIPYLAEQKNLMAFYRKGEKQTILVLCNYQIDPQEVLLPTLNYRVLSNNLPDLCVKDRKAVMKGYQAIVLELLDEPAGN